MTPILESTSTPAPKPVPAPPPAPQPDIPQDTAYTLAYQAGMFLTADEMTLGQNYFVNWLQLQNQLLYTPGVLSGLVVSNPSGNNLSVTAGAGIDASGHFVVLTEGTGNTITVPSTSANPCYAGLSYPTTPAPVTGLPYTVDTAGVLSVADSVKQLPDGSLVLAQIAMTDQGGIASITDMRIPVASRLPANLAPPAFGVMALVTTPRNLTGVTVVSGNTLRKHGDSVSQVVHFPRQVSLPFERAPQVLVTVRGTMPFATSVSDVMTDRFTLTLTAVMTPIADSIDDIYVNWYAHV